jgi:hypothetical protein
LVTDARRRGAAHERDCITTSSLRAARFQFTEDWRRTLEAPAEVTGGGHHVIISCLPIGGRSPSFAVLQRAEPYGLETQFFGWFLNRTEFPRLRTRRRSRAHAGVVMMDETPAHGAPE